MRLKGKGEGEGEGGREKGECISRAWVAFLMLGFNVRERVVLWVLVRDIFRGGKAGREKFEREGGTGRAAK